MTFLLRDEKETGAVARLLARTAYPGDVLLLAGDLGSGKTALTREFAHGLGTRDMVSSPSFALLHEYQGRLPLYHMDLYRLAGEDEIEEAGLADFLETEGVTVVEWPERLGALRPDSCLLLELRIVSETARRVTATASGDRGRAWLQRFNNLYQKQCDHEQTDYRVT